MFDDLVLNFINFDFINYYWLNYAWIDINIWIQSFHSSSSICHLGPIKFFMNSFNYNSINIFYIIMHVFVIITWFQDDLLWIHAIYRSFIMNYDHEWIRFSCKFYEKKWIKFNDTPQGGMDNYESFSHIWMHS